MSHLPNIQPLKPWSQPLIRWAGSKRKLIPHLHQHIPSKFNVYYEPFAGSACLYFAINPKKAVLSDLNEELISAYQIVRDHPRLVWRATTAFQINSETYYLVRATDPKTLSKIDRAARFFYLNRNCFNGLYRTNRSGQFNVPIGNRTGELPSEAKFVRASYLLRRAKLICGDFKTSIKTAKKNDFVYLDPPYVYTSRVDRNEYGNGSFSVNDIPRLLDTLSNLNDRGCHFLLSYLSIDEFIEALPKKAMHTVEVRRNISGFKQGRGMVKEIMITNRDLF